MFHRRGESPEKCSMSILTFPDICIYLYCHTEGGEVVQEFWTAQEAAIKWGITAQSVKALIHRGRIPGVELKIVDGRSTWIIPPQERPTRSTKDENTDRTI